MRKHTRASTNREASKVENLGLAEILWTKKF